MAKDSDGKAPARPRATRPKKATAGGSHGAVASTERKPAAAKQARPAARRKPAASKPSKSTRSTTSATQEVAAERLARTEPSLEERQWAEAQAAAERRRQATPEADIATLYRQLLRDKCLRAGMVGSLTSATGLIPGLGTLASLAIDGVGDVSYTARLQRELALTTFALHQRQPNAKELQRIDRWILSFGAGGSELVEQVGKLIARQLAKNFAGRLLKRGLPLAEIAYSTVMHLAGTYLVGRRAQLYCIGLSDAEAEVLLESERGIKLQAKRIRMLAQESLELVEERFGMPGRTLASLVRRFTGGKSDE